MTAIIVRKESGLRFLPRPKSLVQAPAPKISPADEGFSLDEKTQIIIDAITDEANQLDDEEARDLWMDAIATFRQTGNIDALIKLTEYRRKVVPIEEFMFGKPYLGLEPDEIYPAVVEACHELDSDRYTEAVFKGALGYGKSTGSNIMMARSLYKLSCMRHPQSTYGIRSHSSIVFTIQSIRLNTAKKAVFEDFGTYVKNSPYFRNVYPYDPLVTSQMIFREQNVSVMPVSSATTGAISMNVIGGVLDEMNFMQKMQKSKNQNAELDGTYSQAKALYNNLVRRRKSRFNKRGNLPGILFLVSSSRFPDDFTEAKAAEAAMCGGTDPGIYVISKSVWEGKGRHHFMDETFRVMIGNNMVRSRIMKEGEEPLAGCEVIDVPQDFLPEFQKDIDGSLRDFAGVTTLSTRPFLARRQAIHECISFGTSEGYQNPFDQEQYCFAYGIPHPDMKKLRLDITMPRAAHIDLGLTRDACGISVGHIAGQKLIERHDPMNNTRISSLMPVIGFDVVMRVVPPPDGEIQFAHIREFLILLRDHCKLPIEWVTLDGFQSVDSRQILRSKGFKVDYLSVEKIDPYRTFRDALYDTRVKLFPHQWLASELAGLEYVRGNKGDDRVDHRPNGTKDVSDSACGVSATLFKRRLAWSPTLHRVSTGKVQDPQDQAQQDGRPRVIRGMVARKSVFRRDVMRQIKRRR
jgi:hypothetical protein